MIGTPPPHEIDWPAWVQAVGSVLAIFTGIAVAYWQLDRARRDKHAELQAYCSSVAVLAGECVGIIQAEAETMLTEGRPYHSGQPDLDGMALAEQALGHFDPSRLASAGGALALVRIRRCAAKLPVLYKAVLDDVRVHGEVSPLLGEEIEDWRREAESARRALRELARM